MAAAKKNKRIVGVVGLGIMGGAFAKNLVAAGCSVVGYDPNAARAREAQRAGVEIVMNVAEVATKAPTIITSLPNPKALDLTARAIVAAEIADKAKSRAHVAQGRPRYARLSGQRHRFPGQNA
jgi:3-hydroxyisobutyrate dehydrogenase-like beta-hydroxyacid dehydrogenase